jgi:hypothetical protein
MLYISTRRVLLVRVSRCFVQLIDIIMNEENADSRSTRQITTQLGLPILNILTEHAVAQALRPLLLLRFQISSHETTLDSDHHGAPGLNFCSSIFQSSSQSMLRIARTLHKTRWFFQVVYSRSLLGSAAQKYAHGT